MQIYIIRWFLFKWLNYQKGLVAAAVTHFGWLTNWGRDKMAVVSQTTLSYACSWMKMLEFRSRFHWSLFLRVQLTIFQHWFRQWLGAGQATSHYLNQWWLVYWRIYASLGLNELNALCHLIPHTSIKYIYSLYPALHILSFLFLCCHIILLVWYDPNVGAPPIKSYVCPCSRCLEKLSNIYLFWIALFWSSKKLSVCMESAMAGLDNTSSYKCRHSNSNAEYGLVTA